MKSHSSPVRRTVLGVSVSIMVGWQALAPTSQAAPIVRDLAVTPSFVESGVRFTAAGSVGGQGCGEAFLGLKDKNGDGVQSGWNTQAGNDDLNTNKFIGIEDVPTVQIDGQPHLRFVLDVAEPQSAGKKTISLDALKIITSTAPRGTKLSSLTAPNTTIVFDLDTGADRSVLITDRMTASRGANKADLVIDLPLPGNAHGDMPVYLYARFGDVAKAQGSAETWMTVGAATIPEPASVALVSLVACVAAVMRRGARRHD